MSFVFLFLALTGFAVNIPFVAKRFLNPYISNKYWVAVFKIAGIGIVVFVGLNLLSESMALAIVPSYPTSTKKLTDDYYFTQQEYGWAAGNLPGEQLEFYQHRNFWKDKKLGHIQWREGNAPLKVNLIPDLGSERFELILQNDQTRLDTVLNANQEFDFVYKPWPSDNR